MALVETVTSVEVAHIQALLNRQNAAAVPLVNFKILNKQRLARIASVVNMSIKRVQSRVCIVQQDMGQQTTKAPHVLNAMGHKQSMANVNHVKQDCF
jgi:hypothetical protein